MRDPVNENQRKHDRAAQIYDELHGEIFNDIEQARLRGRTAEALSAVRRGVNEIRALDFGAGTGNVTRHLLALGAHVTAADISARSLEELRRRIPADAPCTTLVLNNGLGRLVGEQFDLISLYSVLHHVEAPLDLLRELAKLVGPGGVLYIDHEASPAAWTADPCLEEWRRLGPQLQARIAAVRERISWSWALYRMRRLREPRLTLEGDIHVWPDDHIDWSDVRRTLSAAGLTTISERDHLQYRRGWDSQLHERLSAKCGDTRSLIARRD